MFPRPCQARATAPLRATLVPSAVHSNRPTQHLSQQPQSCPPCRAAAAAASAAAAVGPSVPFSSDLLLGTPPPQVPGPLPATCPCWPCPCTSLTDQPRSQRHFWRGL